VESDNNSSWIGTARRRTLVIACLIVSAVAATAWVLYKPSENVSADPGGEPIPDAAPPPIAASAGSVAETSAELAPNRGLWPGLPPLAKTGTVPYSRPDDSDRGSAAMEDTADIDEPATLLELEENFDDLPPHRRGSAAARIAEAWRKCVSYRPLTPDEIDERVEKDFRGSRDFVMSIIAQAPEGPEVDEAIEALAGEDPEDVRARIRAEELFAQRLCSGTENLDPRKKINAELVWLRKAARLGNHSAQHDFLNKVFTTYRPSGQSAQLAEDKQLVLEIIAARLQRRDLLVLEQMARFVGEGYFSPPDPMLAHAYAQAAILTAERLGQSAWSLKNPDPVRVEQFIAWVGANSSGFRLGLTPSELAEAEDLALEIALLEGRP
jgi:hypothetical protein